ncbi:phage tail tape measure protein, partial [Streptomyces sp. G35A]
FKIALTDIRGLADSINYLDDNAISKGADIIDFLNRTSGVVSTVAMSARDAAALGSTLLTLGERTETASTAANAIVQKFAAATKGTKNFKSAMEEIGLSSEAVQKGMSQDATATLNQVIAAIGKLPEDKRIGVMVELVGMEHSDTLAKLVDKPEELARQRALANGDEAKGSMAREAAARNAALSAQWQMTKNRAFNLGAVVGESLLPALLQLMKAVNPLIEGFSRWVQAHPVLVGWVMKLAIGGAALVAVLGAVLVPLALIAGKAMLVRFLFARLALMFAGAGAATGAVAGGMGILYRLGFMLGRAFALLRSAASFLLVGLRALAVFLIANPIVAAFALLATAAYMVWSNWDGIKGGLLAIWEQLSAAVGAWWQSTAAGAAQLWQDLVALKDRFFSAGADLMEGLMGGITSRLAAVRDAVVGAADAVGAWFREKLGIASPSKVFMQYGGWISEGAAL